MFILLVVNFLFYVKYIARITDYYLLAAVLLSILFTSVLFLYNYADKYNSWLKYINFSFLFVLIIGSLYIFHEVPVETLNVDRWSIITNVWKTFENGDYIYSYQSEIGNRPGAIPFYFFMAYPLSDFWC